MGGTPFHSLTRLVLEEVEKALEAVDDAQAERLITEVLAADKVFACAVGRVLLGVRAFVKRLNHLGIAAWCVGSDTEPAAGPGDLLIVASGSGESVVPLAIAGVARRRGARVAHIGSNPASSLAPLTDVFLRIPAPTRLALPGEIPSRQIMTSLFEQSLFLLGDALALAVAERRGISDVSALWRRHANLE
jgi:6-phospho-3-hexuloisomerase